MIKTFFVLLILVSSCAHKSEHPSPVVTAFIQQWREGLRSQDKTYIHQYQKYVISVEDILQDEELQDKFDYYLGSLRFNTQSLAERVKTLPRLYQSQRKSRDISSSEYELFKTKHMTEFYDALYSEREMKLKQLVGEDVYQRLKNNHAKFSMTEETRSFAFPL